MTNLSEFNARRQQQFTGRHMSNAKWVKLLTALSQIEGIGSCEAKLIWSDEIRRFHLENIHQDYDFYATKVEGLISGQPKGFYAYKEIEWLRFEHASEMLDKIEKALKNVGKFSLKSENGALVFLCYTA
jgi:hypothetical protein